MPVAYGYCRVSTEEQANSGLSIDCQKEACRRAFDNLLRDNPGLTWGDCYVDPAVSGTMKMLTRPAGGKLHERLEPGDFVVAAKLDRVFRDLEDCIVTNNLWIRTGVKPCYLDIPLPSDHEMFIPMVVNMGVFASIEVNRTRRRIKEAISQKRKRGEAISSNPPIGCEFYVGKNERGQFKKMIRPDQYALECVGYIMDLRSRGLSFRRIAAIFNKASFRAPQSPRWTENGVGKYHKYGRANSVSRNPGWKDLMTLEVPSGVAWKPPRNP